MPCTRPAVLHCKSRLQQAPAIQGNRYKPIASPGPSPEPKALLLWCIDMRNKEEGVLDLVYSGLVRSSSRIVTSITNNSIASRPLCLDYLGFSRRMTFIRNILLMLTMRISLSEAFKRHYLENPLGSLVHWLFVKVAESLPGYSTHCTLRRSHMICLFKRSAR